MFLLRLKNIHSFGRYQEAKDSFYLTATLPMPAVIHFNRSVNIVGRKQVPHLSASRQSPNNTPPLPPFRRHPLPLVEGIESKWVMGWLPSSLCFLNGWIEYPVASSKGADGEAPRQGCVSLEMINLWLRGTEGWRGGKDGDYFTRKARRAVPSGEMAKRMEPRQRGQRPR